MPRYNKKITRLMNYEEFKEAIQELPEERQAFLSVLFFSGCRVSEALALTGDNINCTPDSIFVEFYRLKGSKQTDPIGIPRKDALLWLCGQSGDLFPFSRTTAWRIVNRTFEGYYPHFFRHNRAMKVVRKFDIPTAKSYFGFSLSAMEHYISKVDIDDVSKALKDEIS